MVEGSKTQAIGLAGRYGTCDSSNGFRRRILNIDVSIDVELIENRFDLGLDDGLIQLGRDLLERLGNVKPHVGNLIVGHVEDRREQESGGNVIAARFRQHVYTEQAGHAVQVVLVLGHR